jgi:hypothetical protein
VSSLYSNVEKTAKSLASMLPDPIAMARSYTISGPNFQSGYQVKSICNPALFRNSSCVCVCLYIYIYTHSSCCGFSLSYRILKAATRATRPSQDWNSSLKRRRSPSQAYEESLAGREMRW